MTLLRGMGAEFLKLRRSMTLWLTVLFPLLCMLAFGWYLATTHRMTWDNLQETFLIWLVFWSAGGTALQAALAANMDGQNWRALLARPVEPGMQLGAKYLTLLVLLLLHALWFSVLILITGLLLHAEGEILWGSLLGAPLATTLFVMPMLLLYTWLATAKGFGWTIGLGGIGMLVGTLLGTTSMGDAVWMYVPWAWPFRFPMMAHALSTNWPQLLFPVVATVVLTVTVLWVSIRWFRRREW